MRFAVALIALLISSVTLASPGFDSVAVFHRPEKVLVLLNERGLDGRLQKMMNAWGAEHSLYWKSQDRSFTMDCGREEDRATCTLKLLPSEKVRIDLKDAVLKMDLRPEAGLRVQDFEIYFESSRGHRLWMKLENGDLQILARRP